MTKCWQTVPEDRPTFKEISFIISQFIEHIAGYLQIGFNPFTEEDKVTGVEMTRKELKIKNREEEDKTSSTVS